MFTTGHHRRAAFEQRRQLHARIARARRRIQGQTTRAVRNAGLGAAWRQRIQEHPVIALATAAGAGMLLGRLGPQQGCAGDASDRLARWLAGGTWTRVVKHLEQWLSTADAARATEAGEREHG